jgi:hypothetical protein
MLIRRREQDVRDRSGWWCRRATGSSSSGTNGARLIAQESRKARLLSAAELEAKSREVAELQEVLKSREHKLAEAQKAQAELIRQQRELEDARRELSLTVERRVHDGLAEARALARREAEEGLKLKVMEKDQTIASMQRKIEELKQARRTGLAAAAG